MANIDDDFERKHRKNLKRYNQQIEKIYHEAIEQISAASSGIAVPPGGFNLGKMPFLNTRIDQVLAEMRIKILTTIVNGVSTEWDLSNQKNDIFVDQRMKTWAKDIPAGSKFYDPNADALKAFINRKVKGLNLSERVWNSVKGFKAELEGGMGSGMSTGKSATSMAREMKQYLNHPDALFRRIKTLDKDGNVTWKLSKAARDFHPGQGVYRSSYKNALRLTGTETNIAYRTSDHERWAALPFVVGQEIRLSNMHPQFDICDKLAGRYPKDFKFVGWHPQCLCYKVAVMISDHEYDKYEDALLEGKNPRIKSANQVGDVPAGFKDFVAENKDRIKGWKNPPYWVKDNFRKGDISNGLRVAI